MGSGEARVLPMHMFVTGGGGFIGSHLVELLLHHGHTVRVLLRPGEGRTNLPEGVDCVVGDILSEESVSRAMGAADVVYHLAARSDLNSDSLEDYRANTLGTRHVLGAAYRCHAKRLVYYSSMLAVAMPETDRPVDETYDRPGHTAYGRSKREAEDMVRRGPVPWTIVRPTFVYGPRERTTTYALFRAIARGRFRLIGPDVLQSFVYVKNLVEATYLASIHPGAVEETFFISDAQPYTLATFAGAACESVGKKLPRYRLPVPVAMGVARVLSLFSALTGMGVPLSPSRVRTMTRPYVYSIEKVGRVLGYSPAYGLKQAMDETIGWYQAQGLL